MKTRVKVSRPPTTSVAMPQPMEVEWLARVLPETTALSVAEIAERRGFNTPSYFIQCFRGVYGCTPAQFRKAAGSGGEDARARGIHGPAAKGSRGPA